MIPAPAPSPPSILTVECGLYAARRLQHALTPAAAREVPRARGRGAPATPDPRLAKGERLAIVSGACGRITNISNPPVAVAPLVAPVPVT